MNIPFLTELNQANRILIAGAGGGFDIVSGIPLYVYLRAQGKQVTLGNLSFSKLRHSDSVEITPGTFLITEASREFSYFPEKFICEWLTKRHQAADLYAFAGDSGVNQVEAGYREIIRRHDIDAVVLVDGGTDSLIFGDEPGIGTIVEDACSMIAVSRIHEVKSYLLTFGFGVDHFHDVNHHACLENIATLIKCQAYLGAVSITKDMPEGVAFMDLVRYLNSRNVRSKSIVANSILSAMEGQFGNHHATERTRGDELFINPLMSLYWAFHLAPLVRNMGFAAYIENTNSMEEVASGFHRYRDTVHPRERRSIPL